MAIALIVRVYHHHHVLMSDEANNMLTIKALIEGEGLREYFFKHPPLFIVFSAMISYPFGDDFRLAQGTSIVFSTLSFIPFYMIAKRLFDERSALLSTLVLAVLPLNILYGTWVKQDSMLLFFFMWSLYFYITNKPWKGGVVFGAAMLTKEFAIFLIPLATGWELLNGWAGKECVKRFLIWFFTGIIISGWWYLVFGGRASSEAVIDAVRGGNLFEYSWHYPWNYYLGNLPADLSWVLLPFFVAGIICLIYHSSPLRLRSGQALSSTHPGINPAPALFPLLWTLVFYIPLSLMMVKSPWYTYPASPALAMTTAVGFLMVWDVIKTAWARWVAALSIAVSLIFNSCGFDSMRYYEGLLGRKLPLFYEEEYLRSGRAALKGDGRVAMLEYDPTLQYYLGISDDRLYYLGIRLPGMNGDMLKGLVEREEIGWFAIDTHSTTFLDKNIVELTSLWGKPKKVGDIMIFRVREAP